jgi:hypothetical protein
MKVNNIIVFNLMMSALFLIYGASLFWIGVHNLDIGWNMRWLECHYNTTLVDVGLNMHTGEPVVSTASDGIIGGSHQQIWGILTMLAGMFVFGMSLGRIAPSHIKITIPTWRDIRGKNKRSRKKKKGKNKGK